MRNIVVTGSLAFDYIMDFPQTFEENILPEKLKTLSVSFLAHNFSKNFGGVAGNIAYNLTLLKKRTILFSSAGKKDFLTYQKHLENTGVNTKYLNELIGEFTANMFLITDKNNCQIAGFYPGAMSKDSTLNLDDIHKKEKIDLLVVAPTVPQAMDNFVSQAKKLSIPYLYDPAQQIPRINPDELKNGISGAEILICNDYELALITKKTGYTKKDILKKVRVLITTLGDKGSVIETKDSHAEFSSAFPDLPAGKAGILKHLPANASIALQAGVQNDIITIEIGIVKIKNVIDPTGAGDAYIAGFLAGYINNLPLKKSGQIGATLASFAIEKYGTQNHRFTVEEFKRRYKQAFGTKLKL